MSASELRQRKTAEVVQSKPEVDLKAADEKDTKKPDFWEKVKTRSVAGLAMLVVFAAILNSNHYVISLFVVLLQLGVFREIISIRYHEAKERKLRWYRLIQWHLLFSSFFWVYGPKVLPHLTFLPFNAFVTRYHLAIAFFFYVIGFIAVILQLRGKVIKYQLGQLAWTLMTLLLLLQSSFAITNLLKGIIWLILPSSLIIINDIMAYFCGLAAGRKIINRPLTSLSPNKTWEGFTGAFFFTLIIGFFLSGWLSNFQWLICPKTTDIAETHQFFYTLQCQPNPVFVPTVYSLPNTIQEWIGVSTVTLKPIQLHSMCFAFFASFIAPFGGFYASAIKRAYKIKDFHSMFPGHGGVTDRMDCQLIMQLFTHVYLSTFILRPNTTAEHVITLLSNLSTQDKQIVYQYLNRTLIQ